MNRQIVQLFSISMLLFAILIAFTSRWSVFEADALKDEPANRRPLIEEQQIARGLIKASDGTVLARSIQHGSGNNRIFERTYPTGPLFSHAVGYSFISRGRAGLERSHNDELTGEESEFGTIFSQLQKRDREGKDVITTLDPKAQKAALAAMAVAQRLDRGDRAADRPGAGDGQRPGVRPQPGPEEVLGLQPLAGCAAAQPRDAVALPARLDVQGGDRGGRARQRQVHAAVDRQRLLAAHDQRRAAGELGGRETSARSRSPMRSRTRSTRSGRRSGETIGRSTLENYMERFGFNQDPQLDYPDGQMSASGVRDAKGRLLDADDGFDVGRVAIGQGGSEGAIEVTPLQMADGRGRGRQRRRADAARA